MTGHTQEQAFYDEAFKRNKGLISANLQEKLKNTRIAVCGMGGVGGIHVETLARLGVGSFHLADGDIFELVNTNRQLEAMNSTLGVRKEDVMLRTLKDINPFAHVKTFGFVTPENIDAFLEDVDYVVDGIDFFEINIRRKIFIKAYEKGIPVITAAPVGFGSSVLIFTKDSMTFDSYFDMHDETPEDLKPFLFGMGLTPSMLQRSYFSPKKLKLSTHTAPSSILGTLAAANWAGAIICKMIEGKKVETAPVSFHFDPYVAKMKRTRLSWGNRGLMQRLKLWYIKKCLMK